ncbi:CTB family bacteriocin [Nodularia sphaerocarpa]|uniref:CTB family bacteriocin n=1 Tax=Nodularia sphaerocarpa TaxID=137816 RepID=UPI001EFA8BB9|nr:CTB family bacteriocin [Nodularia sphaerocarpa]MDB9373642.1 CTB family bacteriocin [Nodularia sphaerocarpa CS-585]MDB9380375.1 CTB family bacteriocin [Nodularia sphaerocarpa CS-585A2]ULP73051.1 hypothetical protein BDGGKGIB_02704 [Nodularia sphaerocarpa UHCC 0038]
MFDQLFTEVSVAEQETISGGLLGTLTGTLTGTLDLNAAYTSFLAEQTNSVSFAQSGPGGSTAGGGNSSTTVFTFGSTLNLFNNGVVTPPPVVDPGPIGANP